MSVRRVPGSFKIASRNRRLERMLDPRIQRENRVRRIIDSIQSDLGEGGTARIRRILSTPRAVYRLELERPDLAYERTTILDEETLVALLERADSAELWDRFTIR
ncbi:MAG: hypothetical protein ACE5IL_14715 [Myxococcota bacterium]